MNITSQDITYHVTVHREDSSLPRLIMLHGFMGSGRCFDHLADALAPFCSPVTVDLLGHGKTGGSADPSRYETDMQVEDISNIITGLKEKPTWLHGYSMGGRLALQYALAHPGSIEGLILESTTPGIEDELRGERRALDRERAKDIETDFDRYLDRWREMPLFNHEEIHNPPEHAERYRSIQRGQSPRYLSASLRGFGTGRMPDVREKLDQFNRPVQLVCGRYDRKFCAIHREMHRQFPCSRFASVDRAGHRVHLDHPGRFVSILKSFITKQD